MTLTDAIPFLTKAPAGSYVTHPGLDGFLFYSGDDEPLLLQPAEELTCDPWLPNGTDLLRTDWDIVLPSSSDTQTA